MKYVVFQYKKTGVVDVILFSELFVHSEVKYGKGWKPVSAGFYSFKEMKPYSESESLKLKPHNQDELLIATRLLGSSVCFTR